jgi:DNA polymerase-3 subunit delta
MAPVGVLRMLTNKMKTLHMVGGLMAEPGNAQEAVRALRPPVRCPRDKILIRQANIWSRAACERALRLLEAAETECKTSALPDEAICGRLILSLTRSAAGARRH